MISRNTEYNVMNSTPIVPEHHKGKAKALNQTHTTKFHPTLLDEGKNGGL